MTKQLIFTILFLTSFFSAIAQNKIYYNKDWKETDVTNAKFYRTVEKKGGLYLIQDYYISGKLQYEGLSKTDKNPLHHEGTTTWYYEDGSIAQKVNFKDDKLHGELLMYYMNGNIKTKGTYINGIANGLHTEHYPSGEILKEANLVNGKMDGIYSQYRYDGYLDQKISYKNGLYHGPYEFYSYRIANYKGIAENGFQEGECQEFNYETGALEKTYTIKDKKVHGTYIQYDEMGKKMIEALFDEGIPQSFTANVEAENKDTYKSEMKLIDGIEHWKAFKNDHVVFEAYYEKGIKTKIWKLYSYDTYELSLTADFSEATCNDGYLQQISSKRFEKILFLDSRFNSFTNFVGEYCGSVKFKKFAADEYADSVIKYYDDLAIEEAEKKAIETTAPKEEMIEETMIRSSESWQEERICNRYKDYFAITACKLTNNDINYTIFIGEDPKSLQIIKAQDKPKKDEIFILYQDESDPLEPSTKYVAFSIPKKLKKAIKKGNISKMDVVNSFSNDFLVHSKITDQELLEILEDELNK